LSQFVVNFNTDILNVSYLIKKKYFLSYFNLYQDGRQETHFFGKSTASGQTKDYKIGICCFFAKHATLRRRSKDWLALLFQWASTI